MSQSPHRTTHAPSTMNALDTITHRAGQLQPRIAVVLGSGWGGLTEHIVDAIQIAYTELDGFPQPTVAGHGGTLWLGRIGAQPVAVMSGRKHGYESGAVDGMALPLQFRGQHDIAASTGWTTFRNP